MGLSVTIFRQRSMERCGADGYSQLTVICDILTGAKLLGFTTSDIILTPLTLYQDRWSVLSQCLRFMLTNDLASGAPTRFELMMKKTPFGTG